MDVASACIQLCICRAGQERSSTYYSSLVPLCVKTGNAMYFELQYLSFNLHVFMMGSQSRSSSSSTNQAVSIARDSQLQTEVGRERERESE